MKRLLAGDIGGTKTHLALYQSAGEALELIREKTFASSEHAELEDILHAFLGPRDSPEAAAFGVAGPVFDNQVRATNLPWRIEARALSARLATARVRLLNDLETTALGALALPASALETLQSGTERRTHRAVIAAGTGLGQAMLFWDGERYQPAATEGGHAGFAPRDEREVGLLRFLQARFGYVSWERVVSGPGLANLFDYLVQVERRVPASEVARQLELPGADRGAIVGTAGCQGTCPTSRESVDWFLSLYGSQAGNHALQTLAQGGVYVAGGIVAKLMPRVGESDFRSAFSAKDERFRPLLEEIPIWVVLEPRASLLGAAAAALELLRPDGPR